MSHDATTTSGPERPDGTNKDSALRRRRWDPWPVSIIVFFSVAIAGCAAFIVFCNRHPADLVADNYYDQEVRFQGQMERRDRAQHSPDRATIKYDSTAGVIAIVVPGQQGAAAVTGTIQLYRPSSVKLDRELKLQTDANGLQAVDARTLAPGLWAVRLSWTAQNQEYYLEAKIVVPGGGA